MTMYMRVSVWLMKFSCRPTTPACLSTVVPRQRYCALAHAHSQTLLRVRQPYFTGSRRPSMSRVNTGRPSSGCRGCFPAFRCNYSWFTTGRSSPARGAAFPGLPSATGRVPFGRPKALDRPPFVGRPWQFQWVTKANLHMSYCWRCPLGLCETYLLLSDPQTWPGFCLGPAYTRPGPDLNSMFPADTWSTGVCVPKTHPKSRERTLFYALSYNTRLPQAHDLSSTLLWL